MPVIRVKVCDENGQSQANQRVKVGECDELNTNDGGIAQFLLVGDGRVDILINGAPVFTSAIADLKKEETFTKNGSGFARA